MNEKMLTVEIHDVSPITRKEFQLISSELNAIGIERPTLLVIPNHQDTEGRSVNLTEDPILVSELRNAQERGSDIVQHGYSHRAVGTPPQGWHHQLMHRYFSRGCAEFAYLSEEQARHRLESGQHILKECGLKSYGFIAPAWQQSPASIRMLAKLGYHFTAFLNHILTLGNHQEALYTPALTFDAGSALVDHGKRLVMRSFEFLSRHISLLRIAIHPSDVPRGRPLRHILRRIQALLYERRLTTYAEWLR